MSYGRHRRPRWHDRPRAWLTAALDPLAWPWRILVWSMAGAEHPWQRRHQPAGIFRLPPDDDDWDGKDDHGNHIGGDLPPVQRWPVPEDSVYQAARLHDGTLLPLDGKPSPPGYNPAWTPCALRQDMPRPGVVVANPSAGPGQLTMWDVVHVRSPWAPRPDDTIIQSGPRLCAGRIALLAGGW